MLIYRLCGARHLATAFTGLGASLAGGRWNHRGTAVIYGSGSLALSALESLVHFSARTAPPDYVRFEIVVPAGVRVEAVDRASLPPGWAEEDPPLTTRDLGTRWAEGGRSLILKIPSAIIPTEHNYLINPRHQDFTRLSIGPPLPFFFDPRLKE